MSPVRDRSVSKKLAVQRTPQRQAPDGVPVSMRFRHSRHVLVRNPGLNSFNSNVGAKLAFVAAIRCRGENVLSGCANLSRRRKNSPLCNKGRGAP